MFPASLPFPPPSDISSESSVDSRFVMDSPTAEAFLERTGVGYGSSRYDLDRGHCHRGREFFEPENGYRLGVRAVEDAVLMGHPTVPSQLVGDSRGEFAHLVSGSRHDQIFYTEDADVKLTHCIRRRCSNCRATETSTWRRSLLSTGKLLCNKCGLFERTHSIPRPEKITRRKTGSRSLRQPPVRSGRKIPPDAGAVNPPHQDLYPPSPPPLSARFADALDPTNSGKSTPQDMSWASPITPDASLSPPQVLPCYYPTPGRPNLYHHVDRQSLSSALSEATMWI